MTPKRTIHTQDALTWLEASPKLSHCSIVTSLPDISEFPKFTLPQWKEWFLSTASLVLSRCPDEGVTIFYQSDIRYEGEWVDKGYLCQKAAESAKQILLWHKIVCRAPSGTRSFGRPSYSHLLCFSREVKGEIVPEGVDVLPQAGPVTWTRGMGLDACRAACEFILSHTTTRTVVDPFCGHGTVLAVANSLGMDAVGVERAQRRAEKAKTLTMEI